MNNTAESSDHTPETAKKESKNFYKFQFFSPAFLHSYSFYNYSQLFFSTSATVTIAVATAK